MGKDDNTIVLEPALPESATTTFTFGNDTITLDLGAAGTTVGGIQDYSYSYSGALSGGINTISIPSITTSTFDSCYSWNYGNQDPSVKIGTNGLDIKEGCDIKIGGKSLLDAISKIEERLAILKPNPEMESKWNELKELGEKYRALEKELYEKEKMWEILKREE